MKIETHFKHRRHFWIVARTVGLAVFSLREAVATVQKESLLQKVQGQSESLKMMIFVLQFRRNVTWPLPAFAGD